MAEAGNTGASGSPQPRTRTRNRVLLGAPAAPRARNRSGGFVTPDPDIPERGIESLAQTTHIDEIVQRYAGRAIPLQDAFPYAAPPEHPNPALGRAVRASSGQFVIAPDDPTRANMPVDSEAAYRKEHQLNMLHRMMFRKVSTAQMAAGLGISVGEVFKLREELFRRCRQEAGSIDMLVHSGRTIAFYDEIRGTALRSHDANGTTHTEKARYLAIAVAAENSKHKFLQVAGFYDSAKLSPKDMEATNDNDDMGIITGAMRALFHPDAYERDLEASMNHHDLAGAGGMDDPIRVL